MRGAERCSPLGAFVRVVLAGLLWRAGHALLLFATLAHPSFPDLLAHFLELLPWHLALFTGWAAVLAIAAKLRPLTPRQVVWIALGVATFTFIGALVFEGLYRSAGAAAGAMGLLATAIAIAVALGIFAAPSLLVPARFASAAALAGQTAWTLLVQRFHDRLGWDIARALTTPSEAVSDFAAPTLLTPVLVITLGVFLARARLPRTVRAAGVLVALAPLAIALVESAPVPSRAGAAHQPDVIVLMIDTMRADHLGLHDGAGSLTPSLDAVAAESIRFTNAFAPSNWTRGSLPGVLTSLPRSVTGDTLADAEDLLSEHLQRAGWATYGVSANPLISARLGFGQGYDRFDDQDTMGDFLMANLLQMAAAVFPAELYRIGAVTNSAYFRTAEDVRVRAERMMRSAPRPAFLYLQLMDVHGPYLPPHSLLPPGFRYRDVSSYNRFIQLRGQGVVNSEEFRPQLENFRQRYKASMRYADQELGDLVAMLRAAGRWDESLVWVLADHGEAFGERDWAGHTGSDLGPVLVRVPLLLKLPRSWGIAPRAEPTSVSTYSLLPTTLSLLGLPPGKDLFGADLAGLVRGDGNPPEGPLFIDSEDNFAHAYAVLRWPWKLDLVEDAKTGESRVTGLYDLSSDPAEEHSLADSHPDRVATLRDDIDVFRIRVAQARQGRHTTAATDPRTEEQLRRLGYLQ